MSARLKCLCGLELAGRSGEGPGAQASFFSLLFLSSVLTTVSRPRALCNSSLRTSYKKTTNYSQETVFQIHIHIVMWAGNQLETF